MSQNLKNKLNQFEIAPPPGAWDNIVQALDEDQDVPAKVIALPGNKKRLAVYLLAAASAAIFLFFVIFHRSSRSLGTQFAAIDSINNQNKLTAKNSKTPDIASIKADAKIQVPLVEDSSNKNMEDLLLAKTNSTESGPSEKAGSEESSSEKIKDSSQKVQTPATRKHTYITIAGPEGTPLKVSAKVAALMDQSSDRNTPQKIAWNKKVIEWKNTMNSTTLSPTPSNFLDLVELTNTLTDN